MTLFLLAAAVFAQEFEVASVKPSVPQEQGVGISRFTYPGGRITFTNFTLHKLIEQAYGLERFQVMVMYGFEGDPRIYYIQGDNATMPLLAERLSGLLRRPVQDETKLTGKFDFKFTFEAEEPVAALAQVGLKLESRKAPIENLIVDHAAKPLPN